MQAGAQQARTDHDEQYDVIVVGGGHAGCEAALASAKLGSKTMLLTLSLDKIAWQPCNPAVGGPAKSQIVHEVDALGGWIGKLADKCYVQKRVLNTSRVCTNVLHGTPNRTNGKPSAKLPKDGTGQIGFPGLFSSF
jgi:hypothetical protein